MVVIALNSFCKVLGDKLGSVDAFLQHLGCQIDDPLVLIIVTKL